MERDEVSVSRVERPANGAPIVVTERGSERSFTPEDRGDDRVVPRDVSAIRAEDTEPYIGLQYVARLFKIAAVVVIVALTAEVVAGILLEGFSALLPLMTEVIRGVVLAALLWGAGDLTLLLIDVGHDVRAARVLLGRLSARAAAEETPPHRSERDRG